MKQITEKILHYAALLAITAGAVGVMWWISAGSDAGGGGEASPLRELPVASTPRAPVLLQSLKVETCEILAIFSGKIRPWETYRVGFETGGRVLELGKNDRGEPLDDGDRVESGQVLAVLDDRVFRSQRGEAAARLEQASSDLRRAQNIRASNRSAVTESELQRLVTQQATSRAQLEITAKALEDATLRSPVAATISRRQVNAGESVSPNQIAFELVQNDDVLLVLNVPESQIRDLQRRLREVERNAAESSPGVDPEDKIFRAHVELEGRDVFGNRWPVLDGVVYRIAEVADLDTSLFEVEVRLPNKDRLLRPGMVATAKLVVDRVQGYRLPTVAVIYRENDAHVFTAEEEEETLEMMYWELGPTTVHRARRVDLDRWVEQPGSVIVPADGNMLPNVIVRGQHRLADGQLVRPVKESADGNNARIDVAAGR